MPLFRPLSGATLLIAAFAAATALAQTPAQQPPASRQRAFVDRFNAANTTHDGHLTLQQAQAANLPMLVRHFDAIDTQHKGYITLQDLRAYRQQERAAHQGGPRQSD